MVMVEDLKTSKEEQNNCNIHLHVADVRAIMILKSKRTGKEL
jgi:hypothetical protein